MKRRIIFCLLCIFMILGLTACGEDGVKVNSANALAKKLASDSNVKINVSKDITLEEPIVVNGEKEIVGSGKIIAAVEDGEELYMITVADGGKLTIGGSVKIDAAGLMGAIYVQDGGSAIVNGKAVVKNASEASANALVEGSLEVKGGNLKDAKGHNVINKKTTVISGGNVTGSGEKYAGIYNEGTLTQTGGKVSEAYNNISNMKGSTFTFEGGSNEDSTRDGVFVAEGATMKATKKDATIINAGARGILLQGKADIKVITVKECGDSLVKVAKTGVLNLGNGILQGGNYHGVENAGTMNMLGGNIQMNANCGIVNTGTLKVTSGNISENANKGILNKHEGKADVTSAMVTFTSNKTAIANEDKAVFEFAKAKLLMSTQTNIYCYDGTINLHDASLNASTSNNVRIIDGVINMTNVEVKGNSQKSGTSHHGIYMEGGVINAENVTVSMTTGNGIRNKGGVFKGKNIIMHDINRVAVSQGKHDYLDVEGLTEIEGLEIQSTNYANVWNEGGGTIKITNGKLAVAASNSVRANDGKMELTNVTIPGHKEGSKDNIHGIYLEGGEIVAKNVTIQNTSGHALRNKNGKFIGTNIKMTNIGGASAISNLPLDDENKNGIISIDGLTIKNANSKNITLDSGVTTIKNATLGKTGGNNIKMQNNAATLYLYNVDVQGQSEKATNATHGIMVEGGNVFGENITIKDTNTAGIRCKEGIVDIKNVTVTQIGGAGISVSAMDEKTSGTVKIDGLVVGETGGNNINVDAGYTSIKNGTLLPAKSNNIKVTGGTVALENVDVQGNKADSASNVHGIYLEGGKVTGSVVSVHDTTGHAIRNKGGEVDLTDVKIYNMKSSQIAVSSEANNDKEVGTVTLKKATISDGSRHTAYVVAGTVNFIDSELGKTTSNNVRVDGGLLKLTTSTIKGNDSKDSAHHGIYAPGGKVVLNDVTIQDTSGAAIRNAGGAVSGNTVLIKNTGVDGINANGGTTKIDKLTTENVESNNVRIEKDAQVTLTNSKLGKVNGNAHNVIVNADGKLVMNTVEILGTTAGDKYGLIAQGGDAKLTDVTIQDVEYAAIRINREASEITGKNITIVDSANGITGSAGTVEIVGLYVDADEKNIVAEGATFTISNATLEKTEKNNVTVSSGELVLNDSKILGQVDGAATTEHGIYISGGSANVADLTIEDTAGAGIRAAGGSIEADVLTITNAGGNNIQSTGSASVKVSNATLNTTVGQHNVQIRDNSTVELDTVTIDGVKVTSDNKYGILAQDGDAVLKNVTILNTDKAAIRINRDSSEITGENLIVKNSGAGISMSAGTIELGDVQIDNMTGGSEVGYGIELSGGTYTALGNVAVSNTSEQAIYLTGGTFDAQTEKKASVVVDTTGATTSDGVRRDGILNVGGTFKAKDITVKNTSGSAIQNQAGGTMELAALTVENVQKWHGIKNTGAGSKLTINGAIFAKSPSNNIISENGEVTLNHVVVNGSNTNHAIQVSNGTLMLNDVEINNPKVAGIRVYSGKPIVSGTDVTIKGGQYGIQHTAGTVTMEDITVSGTSEANKGIYTNQALKLGGKVEATIYLEEGYTIEATKSLKDSKMIVDWAEDKEPSDKVAIQFANAQDAAASKGYITLGSNMEKKYVPYFFGAQMKLNDINNYLCTVTNFAELQKEMAEINNNEKINAATITVAGDITVTELVTVKAGKKVCIQDDATARTIKRGADYHGGIFQVEQNATLELASSSGKNTQITLTIDGGSEDGITNTEACSLVENNGTLKVTSGVQLKNNESSADRAGLGVYAASGSTTTFSGVLSNINSSNADANGSAILVDGATVTIQNALIKDNNAAGCGAVCVTNGGTLNVVDSEFNKNISAEEGAAIYVDENENNQLSVSGSEFIENEVTTEWWNGGAITTASKNVVIEDSEFNKNKSNGHGGAISITGTGAATIKNSTFESNEATYEGGAINMATGAALTLESCEFNGNKAKKSSTTDSISGYGDVRVANNRTAGGITISGKTVVDIYLNQAGTITVAGALAEGSEVTANWRLGKISTDSFAGIHFANEEIMNASKEYISLSDNYNTTYGIKFAGTTGTLVKQLSVANETDLKNAIDKIAEDSDKIGFIKVTENFTMSKIVTIPEGYNVTISDDGTARTITRAIPFTTTGDNRGVLFDVSKDATLTFRSTGNDEAPKLTIDGNKDEITGVQKNWAIVDALANSNSINIYEGVRFMNNSSGGEGCVIRMEKNSGTLNINGGQFIDNITTKSGGVMLLSEGSTAKIQNAKFVGNKATHGGAIEANKAKEVTIENCTFESNQSTRNESSYGGGAIYNWTNEISIVDCTFSGNASAYDGGAIYNNGGTLNLSGTDLTKAIFQNNTASNWAGAIYTNGGKLIVDGYNFDTNKAKFGGAIIMFSESEISNTTFKSNEATTNEGGAIYANKQVTFTDCIFDGNVAKTNGGAICCAGNVTYTFVATDSNKAMFKNNVSNGNIGGAIYLYKGTLAGSGYTFSNNTPEDICRNTYYDYNANNLSGEYQETTCSKK